MRKHGGLIFKICFLAYVIGVATSGAEIKPQILEPGRAPDRLLIAFKRSGELTAQSAFKGNIETAFGLEELGYLASIDTYVYRSTWDLERTLEELRSNPGIDFVEPDYVRRAGAVFPDDPLFELQWSLHNTGQQAGRIDADIDAPEAWDSTIGDQSIVVAVLDTGVDYDHPDLNANMWRNPGEIPGNRVDDDGNGYVDDYHGINAIAGSGNPRDDDGHGTHIAGIIAAVGNNTTGISGVCWTGRIMAVKFINDEGDGFVSDEVEAIDYAVRQGARVINASFGDRESSQAEERAVQRALDAGVLFVTSAGNDGQNTDNVGNYPSTYTLDNIISVASSSRFDLLVSSSNYGPVSVDVAAPGSNIWSTWTGGEYRPLSGTSMAAPHVSGAAALIMSHFPGLDWRAVKFSLVWSGDPLQDLEGKILSGRRINVVQALDFADTVTLSGTVRSEDGTGIEGVDIVFSEGGGTVRTDAAGNFLARVVIGWTGTARPVKLYHDFSPAVREYVSLRSDAAGQDFVGIRKLAPPLEFTAEKIENRSLVQREHINKLTWKSNPGNEGLGLAGYRIYKVELGVRERLIDTAPDVTEHLHRKVEGGKAYTYSLVALDGRGREGAATTASVR